MMHYTGIIIFTSLLAAHLTGDFILQNNQDVSNKAKLFVFIKHLLFITILSYLFCGIWNEWRIPVVIILTHGIVDWIKIKFFANRTSDKENLIIFLTDQLLHLIVLMILALYLQNSTQQGDIYWLQLLDADFIKIVVLISGIILITKAGGIVIGYLVNPFLVQMSLSKGDEEKNNQFIRGFENGGRIIGYLERLLIVIFICTNNLSAIGFLIAAKSVFRFGELKNADNRMEAEYIIIGTLYSFVYAISLGYLINYSLNI